MIPYKIQSVISLVGAFENINVKSITWVRCSQNDTAKVQHFFEITKFLAYLCNMGIDFVELRFPPARE